jgi:16S rRNA (guanine1207-N2)-methyltransferase
MDSCHYKVRKSLTSPSKIFLKVLNRDHYQEFAKIQVWIPIIKKEVTYPFKSKQFKFDIAETLFSTFDIDHGTDVLIRSITEKAPKSILDIGCGYGPLGIILAFNNPQAKVIMTDKDLLAVQYTKYNVIKNNVNNVTVLGSLGVDEVKDKTFDLIVSNIPAKIGDEAIVQNFILEPYKLLNPNGEYWFVVVSALNRLIPTIRNAYKLDIKEIRKRRGHTVYRIKKSIN